MLKVSYMQACHRHVAAGGPPNEKTDVNLPPTGLLTTEVLLGSCLVYKILAAPKMKGKENIAPQVDVCSYVAGLSLRGLRGLSPTS